MRAQLHDLSEQFTCECCGETVLRYEPNKLGSHRRDQYCSKRCATSARHKRDAAEKTKEFVCPVCSKREILPISIHRQRRTCSRACQKLVKKEKQACSVEGCLGKVAAKGICFKHYLRVRKTGSVESARDHCVPPTLRKCVTCGQDTTHITYCSKACSRRRVKYNCEMCGNLREIQVKSGRKRFCSNSCRLAWFSQAFMGEQSPQWKGGKAGSYGPGWKYIRQFIIDRDKACVVCGATDKLVAAHIKSFRDFGSDHIEAHRPNNLVAACRSCHGFYDRTGRSFEPFRREHKCNDCGSTDVVFELIRRTSGILVGPFSEMSEGDNGIRDENSK